MSKFLEQVHISISSFEKNIIYYDLKLSQKMADHHYFSFVWQYTGKAIIDPEDQEKAISKYIGSQVIFTFKVNGIKLMSKGIINGLKSVDIQGGPAGLHVYGISHTVLLNDHKKSRIFLNRNLQQIVLSVFAETNSDEFYQREAIVPTYTKAFVSKSQYNETSFDFLKRLAMRYGQWYYFDGMRMQFGQTKTSKVKLINGSSLHKFTIETNLVSHKTSFGGYDYNVATSIKNAAEKTDSGSQDRFAVSMGWNQGSVATKDLDTGAYTNNAQNKEEIVEMVKLETAGKDANSVFYSGISYYPIGLGQVFTIQNKTVEHEVIAIEVTHHSEVNGNYNCEFKAIPAGVAAPHYTNVNTFAVAESQPAKVTDNNDPEKMGRVKVEFYWNGWKNDSDWIRIIQPHAGSGKGFYFIPEIKEEVLVCFEGSNADRPYVLGAQYNGKELSGYATENNDLKVIQTRSGHIIKFTEDESIIITDKSGNEIHLDTTEKNINISAPETMTFNCKNMNINVAESMNTNVGLNKTNSIGGDYSEQITGSKYLNIGINFIMNVVGSMSEFIAGNKEIESKGLKEMAKEINLQSADKDITMQSAKNVNNYSGEISKNG